MCPPGLEDAVEFAENPEPRCPCVLLLDVSGSMQGAPIDALNAGLHTFRNSLNQDSLAARRVEVAIVTFANDVKVVQDFVTADNFHPPTLTASGSTHMGAGILQALDLIQARKQDYNRNGIKYYRPWVFLLTDGAPTDGDRVTAAAQRIRDDEEGKRLSLFAVGVEGADMNRLATIAVRQPVKLNGLDFASMFVWLSASMQRVSQSKPGEQVALSPVGWGSV